MAYFSAATWAAISAVTAGVGVASAAYQGNQQNKIAKKAAAQAEANALAQEKASDEATNAANMKLPDTAAMLSGAMLSGKAGQSGTMLTGAQGVKKDRLGLQKNTLLGS